MARCYVRFRGEVTGPFDPAEVKRLYARELLTAAHEVSTDQRNWQPLRPSDVALDDESSAEDAAADAEGDAAAWSGLLAPAGAATIGETVAVPVINRLSPHLSRIVAVSCGALIAFTTFVPVGLAEDGGVLFAWGGDGLILLSALLTLLLALVAIAAGSASGSAAWAALLIGVAGVGLGLLPLSTPSGLPTGLAWWQCCAGGLAAAVIAAPSSRRLPVRPALLAGAVLTAAAAITIVVAVVSHAMSDDRNGRFVVLHALRIAIVTAAWTSVLGLGVALRRSPPAFTIKDPT